MGTLKPVALATAVHSIDGLEPSRKLLNIFGVQAAALGLLGSEAVVAPHRFRRRFGKMRQPFATKASYHNRKAAGARPVHQLADQGRLVAKGQRINDTGLGRLARQQRAAKRIRFHRDVDHMLPMRKGLQAVLDRCDRVAGAFHTDVDLRVRDHRMPVVGNPRCSCFNSSLRRLGLHELLFPSYAGEVGAGSFRRQVGNRHQVYAGCFWNLRQVHRAEFTGADQSDANRPVIGCAPLELGVKAHL